MRIQFVLPGPGTVPAGGFGVVYGYANRLYERGHEVVVVHAANRLIDAPWHKLARKWLVYWGLRLSGRTGPARWFGLNKGVREVWVHSPSQGRVEDADAVIATSWETAEWAAGYSARKGRKFYLIQHLEDWSGSRERVMATWRLPLTKIVIARWLQDIARSLGEEAYYAPNGLDWESFGIDVDPGLRRPTSVALLHHTLAWKGYAEAMAALAHVATVLPELRIRVFGVSAAPPDLPPYATYERLPSRPALRRLYNESAIFLTLSRSEGWGLPACEAMMCGCALVASDVGGHREFARDEETALLVPPGDPAAAADAVLRLIRDSEIRMRLAKAGHEGVKRFTWEAATDRLESILMASDGGRAAVSSPARKAQAGPLAV